MRLYSRTGAVAATHDGVHYEPQDDGGFDFPDHVASQLATFPHWETHTARQVRLAAENKARRSDPTYTADLLERIALASEGDPRDAEIAALRQRLADLGADDKPAARQRSRKAAAKAAEADEGDDTAGEGDD